MHVQKTFDRPVSLGTIDRKRWHMLNVFDSYSRESQTCSTPWKVWLWPPDCCLEPNGFLPDGVNLALSYFLGQARREARTLLKFQCAWFSGKFLGITVREKWPTMRSGKQIVYHATSYKRIVERLEWIRWGQWRHATSLIRKIASLWRSGTVFGDYLFWRGYRALDRKVANRGFDLDLGPSTYADLPRKST